jgi:hypothetical protein
MINKKLAWFLPMVMCTAMLILHYPGACRDFFAMNLLPNHSVQGYPAMFLWVFVSTLLVSFNLIRFVSKKPFNIYV